jgi:hypothetical protein
MDGGQATSAHHSTLSLVFDHILAQALRSSGLR